MADDIAKRAVSSIRAILAKVTAPEAVRKAGSPSALRRRVDYGRLGAFAGWNNSALDRRPRLAANGEQLRK